MYNRYINSIGEDFRSPFEDSYIPPENPQPKYHNRQNSYGSNNFNSRSNRGIFGNIKNIFSPQKDGETLFDMDTVFLIIIVYFLVADGEDDTMETLIIVAALVLFGF